jgi:hypothetical protein
MIKKTFTLLLGTLALSSLALHADDAAVLKQIDANASAESQEVPRATPPDVSTVKSISPVVKKKVPHSSSEEGSSRKIPIWGPRDKLPKEIVGQGVAGDFVIMGEYLTGGTILVPSEDNLNPFARSFVIVNATSGYPRGTYLELANQSVIHIPRSNPLIFMGRLGPGTYAVKQVK